jgi:uncharacterized protein YecE (DUF72 family)
MTIHIGTCSWADKLLIDSGRFHPPDAKTAEARLLYYTSVFPTVEVHSSCYAITATSTAWLWVDRTPDDFTLHLKATRPFTDPGS